MMLSIGQVFWRNLWFFGGLLAFTLGVVLYVQSLLATDDLSRRAELLDAREQRSAAGEQLLVTIAGIVTQQQEDLGCAVAVLPWDQLHAVYVGLTESSDPCLACEECAMRHGRSYAQRRISYVPSEGMPE